jgi:acetyltransferase-like isoleucine patch superfamily enzyme
MQSKTNESRRKYHSANYYTYFLLSSYLISMGIPAFLFFMFLRYSFIPYVLNVPNFLDLFLNRMSLITLLLTPLILIGCYLLHLFLVAIILRLFVSYTEKKEPFKDGIIPREVSSKSLKFYHVRSFIIKYPKWAILKSPFPWLTIKLFNFAGVNHMGKGSTFEEQVTGDKYVNSGENCYFGLNSIITSHLVEGIRGNVQLFTINIGDNVTMSGLSCLAPGVKVGNNVAIFPNSGFTKQDHLKDDNYYLGIPGRKLFTKRVKQYTSLSEEQIGLKKKSSEEKET